MKEKSKKFYFVRNQNGQEEVIESFSNKQECFEFCKKQDERLANIHNNKNHYLNGSVFFNVYASNDDFFPKDERVINWYSVKGESFPIANFSIKGYCDLE